MGEVRVILGPGVLWTMDMQPPDESTETEYVKLPYIVSGCIVPIIQDNDRPIGPLNSSIRHFEVGASAGVIEIF